MNRLKSSRWASFLIVGGIYVVAGILGIWIFRLFSLPLWLRLLVADVAATVATFVFSLIFCNASVYDPYWSVQPIVILLAFSIGTVMTPAKILLLIAVCLWGIRLTANWAYTFHGLNHQDWRYTMLKEKTACFYPIINFIGIHMVPTLVVYGCTLPAVYVFGSTAAVNSGCVVFFCLSIGAVILQGTADCQMHRFRKNKTGGFIRIGLWKHSRHPNYLGEILMWWGVGLFSHCLMPHEWYLLAGAAANTLLFLCVSIPMADGKQSRKDGFGEYKAQTRMLFPLPKLHK